MNKEFVHPDFTKGSIELRFENDVVCIYGTPDGLQRLSDICLKLIKSPAQGHIHLEDEQDLLTENSANGAVAIFDL